MRTLLIPLALVALPAFAVKPTNSLFVIVHTVDRVVADYYCSGQFAEVSPDAVLIRSTVLSQGSFTWHATGGTAPYKVIRDVLADGGECITVMDADGNTASGCGSINEVHSRRFVDCSAVPDTSSIRYAPLKNLETPSVPISVGHPVPGPTPTPGPDPTVDPKNPGQQPPPPPPPTPGPRPKDPDHLKPVSDPTPPPAPPVGPNNTLNRPPVRRITPAPGPTSHGTTTIHRVNSPTGGGNSYHGTSNSSGSGSGSGGVQKSPVPH